MTFTASLRPIASFATCIAGDFRFVYQARHLRKVHRAKSLIAPFCVKAAVTWVFLIINGRDSSGVTGRSHNLPFSMNSNQVCLSTFLSLNFVDPSEVATSIRAAEPGARSHGLTSGTITLAFIGHLISFSYGRELIEHESNSITSTKSNATNPRDVTKAARDHILARCISLFNKIGPLLFKCIKATMMLLDFFNKVVNPRGNRRDPTVLQLNFPRHSTTSFGSRSTLPH